MTLFLKNWESHEKYIDLQLIVEGQESMGYVPVDRLEVKEDQRSEKDMIFYKETLKGSNVKFTNGFILVYNKLISKKMCTCAKIYMHQH